MPSNVLYFILLSILSPVFYLYWLKQSIKHNVPIKRISERFGYIPNLPKNAIWIHAASIGELNVANMIKPHIEHLGSIIISSSTCRGKTTSQTDFFLPYDHPVCVKKVLSKLKPKALILIETEIWPNLIKYAECPVFLLNGRLSEKSHKKYLLVKPLIKKAFSKITGVWCSSEIDAGRFKDLGATVTSIHPNIKYLNANKPDNLDEYDREYIVFSCTHPGEETMLIPVFEKLIASHHKQKLVLIPRHGHRKQALEKLLGRFKNNLHIEDRFGYTHYWYERAKTVFIGGSFIEHGGQNPIEPLTHGCVTVIGPYYYNFQQVTDHLIENNLIKVVYNAEELEAVCLKPYLKPSPWPFFETQIKLIKQSLNKLVLQLN